MKYTDLLFDRMYRRYRRPDGSLPDSPTSTWIRKFSDKHHVLGVLLKSGVSALTMVIIWIITSQNDQAVAILAVAGATLVLFSIWFGLLDEWRRRREKSIRS